MIRKREKLLSEIELISRGAGRDDCWEWDKSLSDKGYGSANYGIGCFAHKMSLSLFEGPVPSGLFVCHLCGNRQCVNPAHLVVGTAGINNWHKTRLTSDDMNKSELLRRARVRGSLSRRISGGPKSLTAEEIEMFWSRADVSDAESCWLWTYKIDPDKEPRTNYGSFHWRDYGELAHVVSFFIANGRWPDRSNGKELSHRCGIGLCVNPDHLDEFSR